MNSSVISTSHSANQVIDRARAAISSYCVEHCTALCCQKGFLVLSPAETSMITENKEEFASRVSPLFTGENSFSLAMGCPQLKELRCLMYTKRPKLCQEYPVFQRSYCVQISSQCPAIQAGVFEEFAQILKRAGFRIEEI